MANPDDIFASLVEAPWGRARYVMRVQQVVRRYELLLSASLPVDYARQRPRLELLVQHPGGLAELESTPDALFAPRRGVAVRERGNIEDGASLPPLAHDDTRVRVLALADLTWWVGEFRALRRLARRKMEAGQLADAYQALLRADPLPNVTPEFALAASAVPASRVRRHLIHLLALRYGRRDLQAFLLPPADPAETQPIEVCASADLVEGQCKKVEAFGRTVAVFRTAKGVFALDDTCPHRGASLSEGCLSERGEVLCPLHGWPFDLGSGAYTDSPRIKVQTYEVLVRDDMIYLMGAKAR